jgi:tRNA(Ile)-lysidine synthase
LKIPQHNVHKNDLFLKEFFKKIESFIVNELFLGDGDRILCAVSGGVDSVSLLDILVNLGSKYNFTISVAHFNHKLRRKASDDDELFVKELAESYGLPFFNSSGNVRQYSLKNSLSIELAARELRYGFFEEALKKSRTNFIATAHTSDDVVETFLINLLRGSGLTGLSGIPAKRPFTNDASIIRPLLCFSKSQIIEYAMKKHLVWREDETNALLNYTRNKIRLDLLPKLRNEYNNSVNDALLRTAKLLNGADKFVTEHVGNLVKQIVTNKTSDGFSLKLNSLNTLDDFIQGEVIQYAITTQYHIPPLPMSIIDRIIDLSKCPVGSNIEINKNLTAYRDRVLIIIDKKKQNNYAELEIDRTGEFKINGYQIILKEISKKSVKYSDDLNIEYFDFDLLPSRLILRSWKEGDKFIPLGMKGKMKVSDFLINLKISIPDKLKLLILATKNDIIWLCGLRSSDKFKITDKTKRFLRAEFIKL